MNQATIKSITTVSVCLDCADYLYGAWERNDITEERALEVQRACDEVFAARGAIGDISLDTYFSWASCDTCGSRLGGDRNDIEFLD